MSYTVTIKGGEVYQLDNINGQSLQEHWEAAEKPFPVRLGTDTVTSVAIISITKNPELVVENLWLNASSESTYKKCQGKFSIQREINRIAEEQGGKKGYATLIRNAAWRETTRKQLREVTQEWCDYRAGTCFCNKIG